MRSERVLWGVGLVATLLRLVWIPLGRGDDRFSNADSLSYRLFAEGFPGALGVPSDVYLDVSLQRTPGYPALVWATGASTGSPVGLLLVQALLGGLVTVLLTYALARRLTGERQALVAATVVAFDPVSVAHSLQVGTETLFTVLLLSVTLALARTVDAIAVGRRETAWSVVSGVALGSAALVRPQAAYVVPLVAAVLGVYAFGRAGARRALGVVVVLVAVVAVSVGPWVVRNHATTGRWIMATAEGQNVADLGAAAMAAERRGVAWWPEPVEASYARHDRAVAEWESRYRPDTDTSDLAARDAALRAAGWEAVRDHPRGALMVATSSGVRTLAGPGDTLLGGHLDRAPSGARSLLRGVSVLAVGAHLVAVVAGLVVMIRRRLASVAVFALLPASIYLVSSAGPQAYARFRVPMVPFMAVLAGLGAVALVDRLRRTTTVSGPSR